MLTVRTDVGVAIFDVCMLSVQRDKACLAKAASIVRKQIFVEFWQPDGILQNFVENSAIPFIIQFNQHDPGTFSSGK